MRRMRTKSASGGLPRKARPDSRAALVCGSHGGLEVHDDAVARAGGSEALGMRSRREQETATRAEAGAKRRGCGYQRLDPLEVDVDAARASSMRRAARASCATDGRSGALSSSACRRVLRRRS